MDALTCLTSRQSMPPRLLAEPVPTAGDLDEIFRSAMSAPDHGAVRPWRFLIIQGEARERLGDVFADAMARREPEADAEALEKARAKPLRAPMLIAVLAEIVEDHPKAPVVEQILAAGAASQNMLNAIHAKGYGGILLSGANCYDDHVKAALGLAPKDAIIGFIYVGTPSGESPVKQRPEPAPFVRDWHGPDVQAAAE